MSLPKPYCTLTLPWSRSAVPLIFAAPPCHRCTLLNNCSGTICVPCPQSHDHTSYWGLLTSYPQWSLCVGIQCNNLRRSQLVCLVCSLLLLRLQLGTPHASLSQQHLFKTLLKYGLPHKACVHPLLKLITVSPSE
jgi:hypothetical protein